MKPRRIFMLAGESSGDLLGQDLMNGLRELQPDTQISGIGGPAMQQAGMKSLFPYDELSVMGFAEVGKHLPNLLRRLRETTNAVLSGNFDALVTIDSPDFSLRVCRRVKRAGKPIKIVHYVSPTIWAWRPRRAVKIRRSVDHILALFPFEPAYLNRAGIPSTFVGHPTAFVQGPDKQSMAQLRNELRVEDKQLLAVLPGSRKSEIDRLLPVFANAANEIVSRRDDICLVVAAARSVAQQLQSSRDLWPTGTRILDPRPFGVVEAEQRKRTLFSCAHLALAASGTVTLELARFETPMVVAYDMHWLSRMIVKRLLLVDTVTLANLIVGRNVVPEFLGQRCRSDAIASELSLLLKDERRRQAQVTAFNEALDLLGRGGEDPGLRAARAVFDAIESEDDATLQDNEHTTLKRSA